MKKKYAFELIGFAGLVAGLMLSQGCRTTYTEQASAEDLSLRPMPESLAPEATGDVVPREAPVAKEEPYWKQVQQQGGTDPYAEAAEPAKVAPGAPSYTSYTIKNGDTVSHVAVRYGLRWQDIAAVNPGVNVDKIRVGQVIRLPGSVDLSKPKTKAGRKSSASIGASARGESVYIVKKNDILGRIARAHGVKISEIKRANGLKSDFIREGQKLVIPAKGGSVKKASAPSVAPKKPVAQPPVAKPAPKAEPVAPAPAPAAPVEAPGDDIYADLLDVEAPVVAPPAAPAAAPVIAPPAAPAAPAPVITPPPMPVAPAPAVSKKPAGPTFSYRVLEGEDLYEVGIHWGVTTEEIKALNPGCIAEDGKIVPGTVLKIPAGAVAQ